MKKEITNEEFEKMSDELIISYAEKASQKIWHQMAMQWNWDSSSAFLNWLVDNPKTDKATALMIYWKSAPRFYKQFEDRDDVLKNQSWAGNDFDFVEKVEKNYTSGFYQTQIFEFDPKNDEQGEDWTSDYSDKPQVREIPKVMLEKLNGEQVEVPENFTEGIPPEVYDKLDEIYETFDIIDD